MDPVVKSLLTSVLKDALTGVGTVLVARGYLSADAESQFIDALVGIVLVAASQAVSWWKSRQVTPTAAIQQVNKQDNGVKVVPADVPGTPVDAPQKETK